MTDIARSQTDNQALNALVEIVTEIRDSVTGAYSDVTGDNAAAVGDSSSPHNIAADSTVVKRVVTNLDVNPVQVLENNCLVAVLSQFQTWVSDLSGKKAIKLECFTGLTSTAAIANYKV